MVEEGECVLTVTQHSGQGRYDKIVAMIEESEQFKSAAESQAAHWADKLVPYTLAGSALVYLLTRNVTRAMSVLMVDFSLRIEVVHAPGGAVGHGGGQPLPRHGERRKISGGSAQGRHRCF